MSRRSLKRVLTETSLERKCRLLFGVCLAVLILGSFWTYGNRTESLVAKQNPSKARPLVDTAIVLKHWKDWTENNVDMKELVADFTKNLQSQDFDWDFVAAPKKGQHPSDPWERELVNRFQQSAPRGDASESNEEAPDFEYRYVNDREEYEYYQPVYATKQSCVGCHVVRGVGPQDLALGNLIAVARVRISNRPTKQDLNWNRAILLSTAIITVFLAMVASYVIVRFVIVKPLKHLRDVSDAVSHGDVEQRADIHTADEFEELAVAFNRMLRHLVEAQQELRQANSNLDGKVDELAQLNMRLFEMNRLKSDFLATMSHELRTPLNSIIGFSDVLGSIKSLDDKQHRYVQNIQKSGKMLLDMINDILDLAKIESGKMELRVTDFRIEHVVGAQCDMARPLTEKKNIDLEIEIGPVTRDMHQDQGKVQQILNNLLSNAIKFTPEGGRIVITAREGEQDELVLRVADTGVGIAEQDQTAIFEKFRQGNTVMPGGDAMTREYSGTGLGLSIVKELCKLLGGEVSLESELGKGSTFTIRLPWSLEESPRHDPALTEPLAELTRPRRENFDRPLARAAPSG